MDWYVSLSVFIQDSRRLGSWTSHDKWSATIWGQPIIWPSEISVQFAPCPPDSTQCVEVVLISPQRLKCPGKWDHHCVSKRRASFNHWRGATFWKNGDLNSTAFMDCFFRRHIPVLCSVADIFFRKILLQLMKFNTRTLTKHIISLCPETTRTTETRVWHPPETQGTKTVARSVLLWRTQKRWNTDSLCGMLQLLWRSMSWAMNLGYLCVETNGYS